MSNKNHAFLKEFVKIFFTKIDGPYEYDIYIDPKTFLDEYATDYKAIYDDWVTTYDNFFEYVDTNNRTLTSFIEAAVYVHTQALDYAKSIAKVIKKGVYSYHLKSKHTKQSEILDRKFIETITEFWKLVTQ